MSPPRLGGGVGSRWASVRGLLAGGLSRTALSDWMLGLRTHYLRRPTRLADRFHVRWRNGGARGGFDITAAEYAALAAPGAGAPPNGTGGRFDDATWAQMWQDGQVVALGGVLAFDTASGRLEPGDVASGLFAEDPTRLYIRLDQSRTQRRPALVVAASDVTGTGTNLTLVASRPGLTLVNGVLTVAH